MPEPRKNWILLEVFEDGELGGLINGDWIFIPVEKLPNAELLDDYSGPMSVRYVDMIAPVTIDRETIELQAHNLPNGETVYCGFDQRSKTWVIYNPQRAHQNDD